MVGAVGGHVGAAGEVVGAGMAEFLFTYTQIKLQIHPNEKSSLPVLDGTMQELIKKTA